MSRNTPDAITGLPQGNITYKTIKGHRYAYYQWNEGGRQRSRRVKDDELGSLSAGIAKRKELMDQLKKERSAYGYKCLIRIGAELDAFTAPVALWKKRDLFQSLHAYVYGPANDKVFILYGLRRTGKTTLIRQLIREMDGEMKEKTAFLQARPGLFMADINQDLRRLEEQGYRYVFVDEVTLLDDFVEGAALFSDIFAASGMKIMLSGTDSLGFLFAQDEQLFDRCITCHTTFIPYREFARVLGMEGIDTYISYGGTMSLGGKDYHTESPFSSSRTTEAYLDSAIARNIQHSLKQYQAQGHFRALQNLYEHDELTGAINRVVEDMNHAFTLEVLTREWKSGDLGLSARNLRGDREHPDDILDRVDAERVTATLKNLQEIKNADERKVEITKDVRNQIKEYLRLLDLTVDIETRWIGNPSKSRDVHTVFSQPGMRYSQVKSLVTALMEEPLFMDLPLERRRVVSDRILDGVRGRMMEDIVLLETKTALPTKEVFKLQFAVGEFDMVVFDPAKGACQVFEIKHSAQMVPAQRRHLTDEEKLEETERIYGQVTGRSVIYRGESGEADGVTYVNVESYLEALPVLPVGKTWE